MPTTLTITVFGNDCFEYTPIDCYFPIQINGNELDNLLFNLPSDIIVEYDYSQEVAVKPIEFRQDGSKDQSRLNVVVPIFRYSFSLVG